MKRSLLIAAFITAMSIVTAGQTAVRVTPEAAPGAALEMRGVRKVFRQAGVELTSESEMARPGVLPALYDAVIFVDKTTRARPMVFP